MPAKTIIKLRRDTAANWTSTDPVLASGEPGIETDTGKLKLGDGSTSWTALGYSSGGAPVEVGETAPGDPDPNTLWWNSASGTLYINYDGYWVEAVTGVVGPQGIQGIQGETGAVGGTYNAQITVSTSTPTGGSDGDIWFTY